MRAPQPERKINMELSVKLEDGKVREAVTEAVLRSLDENARRTLIEAAIAHLLAPATDGYRKGTSPLQELFNRTIEEVSKSELEKLMAAEDSALRVRLRSLHEEAARKVFDDLESRTKIVERVADGIRRAITGDRY
jgi:biopolymer transport protein ExbB/TolQ